MGTNKRIKPNIMVTGGAGYIGSHACKALDKNGFTPVVYDNFSSGDPQAVKWGPYIKGDVQDVSSLVKAIQKYKPKAVMHFAALIAAGESVLSPASFYQVNVAGTFNLLEACRRCGVNYFIFSSSAAVYGIPDKVPITEDAYTRPISPYGESKLMVEWMLQSYKSAYGLHYTALRYFNAAGADPEGEIGSYQKKPTNLIPVVLQALKKKNTPIEIFGDDYNTPDGTAIRDYIHVTDLADAHVKALLALLKNGGGMSLNLGTGKGSSVKQVIKSLEKAYGAPIPTSLRPRRAGDPPVLIADSKKAQKILGWRPVYTDINFITKTAFEWSFADKKK